MDVPSNRSLRRILFRNWFPIKFLIGMIDSGKFYDDSIPYTFFIAFKIIKPALKTPITTTTTTTATKKKQQQKVRWIYQIGRKMHTNWLPPIDDYIFHQKGLRVYSGQKRKKKKKNTRKLFSAFVGTQGSPIEHWGPPVALVNKT